MIFEPEPGMRVLLDKDEVIEFLPLEKSGPASVFVYAESGKEGTVYKVMKNEELYALKVFYPEYRDKRLHEHTERLTRFKDLEGFRVAERNLLEPEEYPDLIRKYPELSYSVLMPWIEGTVWGNLMLDPELPLQQESYLQIALTLIRVVNNLESQGLAHCDLSNNNFIIGNGFSEVQLIDVEDMYAPDMPRPIPDISYGTIGYRTRWIAEHGLWGPESDRFAIAILCSEILAWKNQEIRENKSGDISFFDEEEIGEDSPRFKLITRYLDTESSDLPELLEKAWFSKEFAQCPTVSEWFKVIHNIGAKIALETENTSAGRDQSQSPTVVLGINEVIPNEIDGKPILEPEMKKGQLQSDTVIPRGVPPKMDISLDILDFGELTKPENAQKISFLNSGGTLLKVSIQSEEWIDLSLNQFDLAPNERLLITASMNANYPKLQSGREYRSPAALTIESNAGNEVIGARYIQPKPTLPVFRWLHALFGFILRPFSQKHKKEREELFATQSQPPGEPANIPENLSVYVTASDGSPLYQSLPSSNNWTAWLGKGAKITLTKIKEDYASIGISGYYIEVKDESGNEGFVSATDVSVEPIREAQPTTSDSSME